MIALDTTPSVWIGCLSCYNAGRLVGEWYDALDAENVTTADLHLRDGIDASDCEELWCMDVDNMPVTEEMSPVEATAWGKLAAEAGEDVEAFTAWCRMYGYTSPGDVSVSMFQDTYRGRWDSFEDYADSLIDDIGLLDGVPDHLQAYFDTKRWANDLSYEYTTAPAPDGGCFVFSDF